MTEFQRQLKDPRWQKKRLEILERDEWTCQMCGDTEATLTVHHKSYKFDGKNFSDLWDYDNDDLVTYCEECHSEEESELEKQKKKMYFTIRDMSDSSACFYELNSIVENIYKHQNMRVCDFQLGAITLIVNEIINRTGEDQSFMSVACDLHKYLKTGGKI